jgi:hypothetical protein
MPGVSDEQRPPSHRPEDRVDLSGLGRLADRPPPPKGEAAARVARGLSVLLLAVAAAGLPWYLATRGGSSKPSAGGTHSPTASPTASVSPTASPRAATYEVANVSKCLHIRPTPSARGKFIDCLTPGVRLRSDGQSQQAEGHLWRRVYDPFKKAWGWAADEYLRPAA